MEDKQKKSDWKNYIGRGLTSFFVIAAAIALFFAFWRFDEIMKGTKFIFKILQPIIIGCIIAYLLNPIVCMIERPLRKLLKDRVKKNWSDRISRGISVLCALIIGIMFVVILINMIMPELIQNIIGLVNELPDQMDSFLKWFKGIQKGDGQVATVVTQFMTRATDFIENWSRTELLGKLNLLMGSLTVGVINVLRTMMNIVIGIIVSIYILLSKEVFAGQAKKGVYALAGVERGNFIVELIRKINEIFGGFIMGKLLDSLIIGILCFICLTVMDMPYTLLVSVIVGVTNVIPFFGPYIGAIPSAALILLTEPMQGLYFIIFILVLQQIDGNIIGPKILGDSTGLSAFWVVFAILLGGGLFGFIGMIIGVPTLAVIFYIIQLFMDRRLKRHKLPMDSKEYQNVKNIKVLTYEIEYLNEQEETVKKEESSKGEK